MRFTRSILMIISEQIKVLCSLQYQRCGTCKADGGLSPPPGSLFMDFIRMIDYIRPRFFIMENVKGIMSAPLKVHPAGGTG